MKNTNMKKKKKKRREPEIRSACLGQNELPTAAVGHRRAFFFSFLQS